MCQGLYNALEIIRAVFEALARKISKPLFQTGGWDKLFIQDLGGGGRKTIVIYPLSFPDNPKKLGLSNNLIDQSLIKILIGQIASLRLFISQKKENADSFC